jgi:cytochrome c553
MKARSALATLTTLLVGVLVCAQVSAHAAPSAAHRAVEKALPLLQDSAITWTRVAKCFSCHHQGLGSHGRGCRSRARVSSR